MNKFLPSLAIFSFCLGPVVAQTAQATVEFSERVVAGGPEDAVTVRHIELSGSQEGIGAKLAEIAVTRHGIAPIQTAAAVEEQRLAFYESTYPFQHARAKGAARFFAELGLQGHSSLLPYNMPPEFGCSVVFYPPEHNESGHGLLSRNYDFTSGSWTGQPPSTGPDGVRRTTQNAYVMEIYPDRGYPSMFLCAYELMGSALDGINSEGLTVAILTNAVQGQATPTGSWRAGLSELEIVRFLLETCATAEEAREALDSISHYYWFIPCHYIIADAEGDSFVWEYSADLSERFLVEGEGEIQMVTNHPVEPHPTADSLPKSLKSNSHWRFRRLDEEITKAGEEKSMQEIRETNLCVRANAGQAYSVRTLWYAIYDTTDLSLEIDFYLGEDSEPGKDRRSEVMRFQLER
ncbi:MAG: C45 family autoproteolytic acyltransferase/hydrolase [Planctomycetota bacterium]|jgi:hypothetical protein